MDRTKRQAENEVNSLRELEHRHHAKRARHFDEYIEELIDKLQI